MTMARLKTYSQSTPFRCLALYFLVVILASGDSLFSQDKKIALTFDDLPSLGPLGYWRPREISNVILRTLEQHGITAAGFVVEEKVDEDPSTFIVLEDWASRGHLLGNQTYADADFNELKVSDFLHHIADGQKYLLRLSRAHRFNHRYIRFPYLHQGNTESKRKDIDKRLYRGGYEIAHVTVKTSDYSFNALYIENEEDPETLERLKSIFLEHAGQGLDYAEGQSRKVFGRNINHILWLHCGAATAHFLGDLIQLLQERDYQFVSFLDALADPAFKSEDTYAGPDSLSFIDRVAATKGLFFDPKNGELSGTQIEARLDGR